MDDFDIPEWVYNPAAAELSRLMPLQHWRIIEDVALLEHNLPDDPYAQALARLGRKLAGYPGLDT